MRIDEVSRLAYHQTHKWLIRIYGKATKCEGKECSKVSIVFTWALLKGKQYAKNRDNFIMLCRSCHSKYDITDETRKKMRDNALRHDHGKAMRAAAKANKGRPRSPAIREKIKEGHRKYFKPIVQLSLAGDVIKIWPCATDARQFYPRAVAASYREAGIGNGFRWVKLDKMKDNQAVLHLLEGERDMTKVMEKVDAQIGRAVRRLGSEGEKSSEVDA